MPRLIDADAFERAMYEEAFEKDTNMQRWDSGCWIRYKLYERVLDEQPTIDAEPVRHGKWIFKPTFPNDDSEFPMGSLVCSICGSHHSNETPCNYCDNCGARMDNE